MLIKCGVIITYQWLSVCVFSTNNFQNLYFSGRNTNGVLVIRQDILRSVTVLFNSNIVITALNINISCCDYSL
ncbi:hypothetical protein DU258_20580 [Salmonella enterica subsp. enterica]|uniref:Uncharacterized protein n=1 Tax=Salmonella enterica subsp. enterica serovar Macclesfield str. S-1643 TaxID=1242107 RepID=A0A2C9NZ07_SALET|nr:hypothetical protein LFZ25_10525 [Salmonella enterica subsp. enterica serovar Macclesfield str. S-1643]EAC1132935.1 hypothetical protein [Salmonella enterica subsp. enterica serovar Kambole]EBS1110551.1 hypothetical protein [Salmonella enterica subsp. enterica serovar Eingedi]ECH9427241.1 hypothetical protein [Salmonella enterica subsp. enterica]EBS2656081.1 hypothetical protein [Salmonella enterica subsp. enterica serovar Kambole]